jgi:hypothetical protein
MADYADNRVLGLPADTVQKIRERTGIDLDTSN